VTKGVHDGTPILVGVGTAGGAGDAGAEPAELMAQALEAAAANAGPTSLLGSIDRIAVPRGTWTYPDPGRLVASRVGAVAARTVLAEVGVPQQALVTRALQALEAGESEVAVVVGGEARRWARQNGVAETPQPGATPDELDTREPEFVAAPEVASGIVVPPVQQYALIEQALCHEEAGAADGPVPDRDLDAARAEIAELWARFNTVAQRNPAAAFPEPRTANEIATPGPSNRPLAFPYNRWHASQWTVDQAAALVLCTAGAARRHGVPTDRWIFPLVALDANHAVSLSRRRMLHRWPAMTVLGRAAEARLGRPLCEVEVAEIYSCFPSAVRVQQRELGLPRDGTPTVTGGMTFAGGPFNNFVYQATAAVVPMLREHPDHMGLVTTVCGMLTKPGLAVWAARPDGRPPLVADLGAEAAEATPTVAVVEDYRGPATVASFTVTYEATSPARVAVLADVSARARCVAVTSDRAFAAEAVTRSLHGEAVQVEGGALVP
jgi:acetyl-CoA C-acetyltransferase